MANPLPNEKSMNLRKNLFAIQTIDILSQDKLAHKGIGLKRLKGNFWETRKGLKTRILFRWQSDLVEFILAGDHNDIKRYLRNT